MRSLTAETLLMLFSSDSYGSRSAVGAAVTVPPTPTAPPAASTSSRDAVLPATLEATGGEAIEVEGWAEVLDFFLGAMVDGAIEDEDCDEDDAQHALSGSRKCSLYLACQRCRGISVATYRTGWPLAGSTGGRHVAQRAYQLTTARQRAHY